MSNNRNYHVDTSGPIAVYMQIENQIQFFVASGQLKKGETLPSVRDMSSMLSVNPNTVTKAYRDLELMGVVQTRRGVGVTITDHAQKATKRTTLNMVRLHLKDAVAECNSSGVAREEIEKIVAATLKDGRKPYTSGNNN